MIFPILVGSSILLTRMVLIDGIEYDTESGLIQLNRLLTKRSPYFSMVTNKDGKSGSKNETENEYVISWEMTDASTIKASFTANEHVLLSTGDGWRLLKYLIIPSTHLDNEPLIELFNQRSDRFFLSWVMCRTLSEPVLLMEFFGYPLTPLVVGVIDYAEQYLTQGEPGAGTAADVFSSLSHINKPFVARTIVSWCRTRKYTDLTIKSDTTIVPPFSIGVM